MDLLELLGVEVEPETPREGPPLKPDRAFRLRVQHEVEDEILDRYLRAHPSAKLHLPPRAEVVEGRVDSMTVAMRWHEVRALGRTLSDELVTELLARGAAKIAAHEGP
jgi:hypothetical protein